MENENGMNNEDKNQNGIPDWAEERVDDQTSFPEGDLGKAYTSEEKIASRIPNYKDYKWYKSPAQDGHPETAYFYTLGEKLNNAVEEGNTTEVENIIEQNPEAAAEVLPDDNPLNKEAEQAIDGGADAEVNNESVKKAIGSSFLPDLPTKEISQDEYNDMPIDDLEKADAAAIAGTGDYITVAKDLGIDEDDVSYYFEDPSFINELSDEEKEQIKNEPDKKKKIALLSMINFNKGLSASDDYGQDINATDTSVEEDATTSNSGVSPTSPSFTGGSGGGASASVSNPDLASENSDITSNASGVGSEPIVVEKDTNDAGMSGKSNEHLDDSFDNMSFNQEAHEETIKTNGQADLPDGEAHTSDSRNGSKLEIPTNEKFDLKKAIIDASKEWESNNSGGRYLPFKFTVDGDNVLVSQVGTGRKEDIDSFIKKEPFAAKQIINLIK